MNAPFSSRRWTALAVILLVGGFALGRWSASSPGTGWPPEAFAQEEATYERRLTKTQLDASLEEFAQVLEPGVAVRKGHAAIVPDPRGGHAYFLHPDGRFFELEFRVDRRSRAVPLPPEGAVLVRDIRDQLWRVGFDGSVAEVLDEHDDRHRNRYRD
ncbi:MAG: hypothetical protein AAGA57_02015 [Planctomycetota bacterium]